MEEQPRILIVDDEPFNLDYLDQELEDMGYATLSATNGKEALDVVATESPDMILLDIMMPVMDGFETLERLKAENNWRDIPVVVISATDDLGSVVKGIELGAEDYLPKPFEPVLLQARIKAGLDKKRLRDLEQQHIQSLERELEIAREIQADFLPDEVIQPKGWEIATAFLAAREVAGDFYDVFHLPRGYIGLILGDVCDKGVGSALYMALFRSLLRAASDLPTLASEVEPQGAPVEAANVMINAVRLANDYICNVHHSANYSTLFFGALDPASGLLHYITAGHERPLILNDGGIKSELKRTGPVVGLLEEAEFQVEDYQLEDGDLLLVYSDGFTDIENPEGEMFGSARFKSLLIGSSGSAQSFVNRVLGRISAYAQDAAQFDDMTMLAVRKRG
jgi:serine phosphatase RsbU (regulator of sigma subunit)